MDITTIARNTMTTAEEWVINADHDDAGMRINLMNVTTRTTDDGMSEVV